MHFLFYSHGGKLNSIWWWWWGHSQWHLVVSNQRRTAIRL